MRIAQLLMYLVMSAVLFVTLNGVTGCGDVKKNTYSTNGDYTKTVDNSITTPNPYLASAPEEFKEYLNQEWVAYRHITGNQLGFQADASNPCYQYWAVTHRYSGFNCFGILSNHDDAILETWQNSLPKPPGYDEWLADAHRQLKAHQAKTVYTSRGAPKQWTFGELINTQQVGQFIILGFGLILVLVYFLPSGIGILRSSPQLLAIILVNLFAGWTLIGWVAALILSCWSFSKSKNP